MNQAANVQYIGEIHSPLTRLEQCPFQGREGAPEARILIHPQFRDAMAGLAPGAKIVVLTWLDRADRSVLQVHPRHNRDNPLTGVFLTRSPARPNPVGLHEVRVLAVDDTGIRVEPMEALDKTPVIDIKLSLPSRR